MSKDIEQATKVIVTAKKNEALIELFHLNKSGKGANNVASRLLTLSYKDKLGSYPIFVFPQ